MKLCILKYYTLFVLCLFTLFSDYSYASDNTDAIIDKIKGIKIGFCYDCNDSDLKLQAKNWAVPHSQANACPSSFQFGQPCSINGTPAPEETWVYLVDPINNTRNKFIVTVYAELPVWQSFVHTSSLSNDDRQLLQNLEDFRLLYTEALRGLAVNAQSFIPRDLQQSSIDHNLSFLKTTNSPIYSDPTPIAINSNVLPTHTIDCTLPQNRSMFYNLFLYNSRGLRTITETANTYLNNNFNKLTNLNFTANLSATGILKRVGLDFGVTLSKESIKEIKKFELSLDNGKQGRLSFDLETHFNGQNYTHRIKFNPEWSIDGAGYTIDERKQQLKNSGAITFIINPCDAQAIAKLVNEGEVLKSNYQGNNYQTPPSWGPNNACNKIHFNYTLVEKITYTVIPDPNGGGGVYINTHTELHEKVNSIECT